MAKAYGSITITDLLDTATYIYYAESNSSTLTDWHVSPTSSDKYILIYSGPPSDSGQPTNPDQAIYNAGEISKYVGDDGVGGSQFWTTTTAPTTPNYTFTISTLVGDGNTDPKVGDIVLYSYYRYTITSVGSTTVLASNRQSLRGSTGARGYSAAELYLYQRASSAPSAPSGGQTYNFASGSLDSVPSGWSQSIPDSDGNPCYVTETFVYANADSTTVSSWTTPVKLVEDGADGADGKTWNIETNVGQVYKFYNTSTGEVNFSNSKWSYWVTEGDSRLIPGTNYYYTLSTNIDGPGDLVSSFSSSSTTIFTITNNVIEFNFENSLNATFSSTPSWYDAYKESCLNSQVVFIFKVYTDSAKTKLVALNVLYLDFGTTSDMARFAVTATGIEAAVNQAGLKFDGDGLTITGAGLTIKHAEDNTELLKYDTSTNQLMIVGNGSFTGDIVANNGSFNGSITATGGSIGGFTIQEDKLISTSGNVQLLGTDGKIIADDIEIGTGAVIKDYIKVGDAFIQTPTASNGHKFINAGMVSLTDSGILTLGGITIDGATSSIIQTGTNGYEITPDHATFNNLYASKISTSVFEHNKTQLLGGSMLFAPSYKVENTNGHIAVEGETLTYSELFTVDDVVGYIGTEGKMYLTTVASVQSDYITLTGATGDTDVTTLICFGQTTGGKKPLFMGVNSTNSASQFLRPRGFTVAELDGTTGYNLKAFLGDLSEIGKGLSGYGLYSENVYLTGSLITEVTTTPDDTTYAGVNTLNGVQSNKDGSPAEGRPIVFWAGAVDNKADSIREAPFQVTDKGYLYASNGYFTGSLLVNSVIEGASIKGADIYTARIHGSHGGTGLTLLDNSKIAFAQETGATEIFAISSTGLNVSGSTFISISGSTVSGKFAELKTADGSNVIKLSGNSIYGGLDGDQENLTHSIEFVTDQFNFKFGSSSKMELGKSRSNIYTDTSIQNDLYLGNSDVMHYERVLSGSTEIGYNLYIGG